MGAKVSTSLFEAISSLDIAKVQEILTQNKCPPDICDTNGTPAMLYCIQLFNDGEKACCYTRWEQKRREILKVLLSFGVAVDAVDSNGKTAAMLAVEIGKVDVLDVLRRHGSDLSLSDNEGENMLMKSISRNYKGIVRYLLQHVTGLVNMGDYGKVMASTTGRPGASISSELLLKYGLSVKKGETGFSALMAALMSSNKDENLMVEYLVHYGADVNVKTELGITPLMLAVELLKSCNCVKLLLDAGADVEAKDLLGRTALMYALRLNDDEEEDDMKGATSTERGRIQPSYRSYKYTKLLLRYGAHVNSLDITGKTPLMTAAQFRKKDVEYYLNILLKAGAKVNEKTIKDQTALILAARSENFRATRFLIQYGAAVNVIDKVGSTPLALALHSLANKTEEDGTVDHFYQRLLYPRVLEILDFGADPTLTRGDQIYFNHLVKMRMYGIMQKMIKNGCPPLLFPSSYLEGSKNKHMSALETALMYKCPSAARFILSNRFLTQRDVARPACLSIIRNKSQTEELAFGENAEGLERREEETEKIISYLHSTPFSLFTLSFVAVSSALDSGTDFGAADYAGSDDDCEGDKELCFTSKHDYIVSDEFDEEDCGTHATTARKDIVVFTRVSAVKKDGDGECPCSCDQCSSSTKKKAEKGVGDMSSDKQLSKFDSSVQTSEVNLDGVCSSDQPTSVHIGTDITAQPTEALSKANITFNRPDQNGQHLNPNQSIHSGSVGKSLMVSCRGCSCGCSCNKKSKLSHVNQSSRPQLMLTRKEKVAALPLPAPFKRALLFQTSTVSEHAKYWSDICLHDAMTTRNFQKAHQSKCRPTVGPLCCIS